MTRITSDDSLAKHVLYRLREDYEKQQLERGRAVHVSDLVFPRRTWLSMRHPKPLTDNDLLYFTAGRAHHEILERMVNQRELSEVRVRWCDIVGSVDVSEDDGTPVEVKTTRARELYSPMTIPAYFVIQLGCYVAMLSPNGQAGEGKLLIFYLGAKGDGVGGDWRNAPKLKSYTAEFENLPKIRSFMLKRKALVLGDTIPSTETCFARLCPTCKWLKDGCDGWGSDLEWRVNGSR